MPEGHCGGFGTSSRMWCGTLKRLGTRRPRPDNQGPRLLGSHSKSMTAIFSASIGRLGCRRGSPRALGERRPPARDTDQSSPRVGPSATIDAPLARRTAAPPLTDFLNWTVRPGGQPGVRGHSLKPGRGHGAWSYPTNAPAVPCAQRACSTSERFLVGLRWKKRSLPRC